MEKEKKKSKARIIAVLIFLLVFAIGTFINLRGEYLENKELGENYVQAFCTKQNYKYTILGTTFCILYILIYFTNRGIKKGLKTFFEKEKKEMPKLLNKSIAFVASVIIATVMSNVLMEKILPALSNVTFGVTDSVFGFDIAFYMFQKPLIETMLMYLIWLIAGLTIYMAIYYIIVFNRYFDGVDRKMMKESLLIKKILRNLSIVIILIALVTALNTTNISLSKMFTIKNSNTSAGNIDIIGASYTDVMLQRWAYLIFAFVIVIFALRAIKAFKQGNSSKVLKNLAVIPGYLVSMFVVIVAFNLIFVNSNKFDKEKDFINNNIKYTKAAYNIDIEEESLEDTGTITQADVNENLDVINNLRIVNEDVVLKTLDDSQKGTGYYSYRNANIAKYRINGDDKLLYISPREITNSGRTYNNKTYEYTHGKGQIAIDATKVTNTGSIEYVQKDVSGKDEQLGTKNQDIYFGLETNNTIATNTKNKQEYDYIDENGLEHTSKYSGNAGLKLSFIDRVILGIKNGDLNLAFNSEISSDSKVLINRNIIKRAKKVMPYLIYDENPYTVVTDDGRIVWVLDAYTVSSQYPHSQYTSIEHDNIKEKINYIRNSVKVIIDSYDGTMKFYITDENDPVVIAYRNIYPTIFEDKNAQIPSDITEHFVYPEFLYNVQAKMLKIYHNVKADILYRTDDVWDFAKFNNSIVTKSSGTLLTPYYTMVKNNGENEIGLIQVYTPESKQNLASYLVGTTDGSSNKLKMYKFAQGSSILGPMQLDNQIEQDEMIYNQIKSLNKTGTKVTKDMVAIPVNNTVLYVESIYQTMLNEESKIPMLKKVVAASGNKLAIGDNLEIALRNLFSTEASNIEIENTDDVDGLIDSIIKTNKNLKKSTENDDWELIGSDVKKLQGLIDNLEKEKQKEDKQNNTINETTDDSNVLENDVVNNEISNSAETNTTKSSFFRNIIK